MALDHGGRLRAAARRYGIPLDRWLDLSTGISPWSWPVPAVPESVYRRLPEDDDGLVPAARAWAGAPDSAACVPLAGSQVGIQALPELRSRARVGVPSPGYAEHAHAWHMAGHEVIALDPDEVGAALDRLDVLVWIQPNNPTGEAVGRETLEYWRAKLASRGGWLLVDEAFVEASPVSSAVPLTGREGLIVLRSVGKFFGLAGLRGGFAFGPPTLMEALRERLGPWTVTGPTRWLLTQALGDTDWQQVQRDRLAEQAGALRRCLSERGFHIRGGSDLFITVDTPKAEPVQDGLARAGILVRRFDEPPMLRFGLPGSDSDRERLAGAIDRILPA